MRKSLLPCLPPIFLRGSSTRTNIVPEERWRTGLKSSNQNYSVTELLHIHLRAINESLWFSAIAYELKQAFRQQCLARTPLATATIGTIRILLLKLGGRVLSSVRRVVISISSSCPYQDIFAIAYQRIQSLPASGQFSVLLDQLTKHFFRGWFSLSACLVMPSGRADCNHGYFFSIIPSIFRG